MAALGEPDEQIADALDPHAARPDELSGRRHGRELALPVIDDTETHDHRLRADCAVPDGGIEVVDRLVVELPRDLEDLVRPDRCDARSRQATELAFERFTAVDDVFVAVLALEPLADLLPGVGGPNDVEPITRRPMLALGRDDLDDVAVLEPVVERHE